MIFSKTTVSDFRALVNWYVASLKAPKTKALELKMANPSDRLIDDAINFALDNAGYFISFLPNKNLAYLNGKTILEIGPGQDFGVPLVLMGFGVKKAILIDRFFCQWDEKFHPKYYRALLQRAELRYPGIDFKDLRTVVKNNNHITDRLELLATGLENASAIPDESVDVTFSNACFEHLANPLAAVKELARITKKGGIGFHQIDFRDHRNFGKPLEFLAMPDWIFKKTLVLSNCYFGNRLRYTQFAEIFENSGFNQEFVADMFAEENYLNDILIRANSTYKQMPLDAIRVLAGRFMLKKK